MNLITKYKIFENEKTLLINEELIKSILEKQLFTKEVIEYFDIYYYPFYPLSPEYDYSYDKTEDKHLLHYEFKNDKLGIITTINFNILDFSSRMPYFRVYLSINIDFTEEKNLFKNGIYEVYGKYIYRGSGGGEIFKSTKVGKIYKDKQEKNLINQIKALLKKIIKENIIKYGEKSSKELFIGYKLIKKLEELPFIKDYSYKHNYPHKKDFKGIEWERCVLKTTFPWSGEYNDYIRLYFDRFDRTFIFHEQYIYKIKKIYEKIKKEVNDEFNN
jgi:hypothetical protein